MTRLVNRAKMNTATTGTGSITLSSPVAGFQTFSSAGVTNGDSVRYVIEDGLDWEIGVGVYSSTGPSLTRVLNESSTGSLLNLTGSATVFVTAAAADLPTITGDATGALHVPAGTTEQRPTGSVGMIRYNTTLFALEFWNSNTSSWESLPAASPFVNPTTTTGQTAYTSPGTYSWVCPADVYYVNVVAVGGGGGGLGTTVGGHGGGGGGLGWINNYAVTPGTAYTVVVGAGGLYGSSPTAGGNSYFVSTSTVCGFGGGAASSIIPGPGGAGGACFPSTQGGQGGSGASTSNVGVGGGGAGGYSGNGGAGGGTATAGSSGTGGAGGGGGGSNVANGRGGAGGGVGILGQGTSGAGGATGTAANGGGGGSGGASGTASGFGGAYGGGGAGADTTSYAAGSGGSGAVRIIWGPNRAFPSTNTGDL